VLPGLGGSVAQWLAYGHAAQSARHPRERKGFGQGDVRGVLGPGAACTPRKRRAHSDHRLRRPGSTGMAILLGAFFLLGLIPGPDMLTQHLPLTFSMVWTIVIANVVTVAVCFLLLNRLAALTAVRGHLLVPVVLVLVFVGSYTANRPVHRRAGDAGVRRRRLAHGARRLGARALRPGTRARKIAENYLYISVDRYEAAWLTRPVVLALLALALFVIVYPAFRAWRARGASHA